MFYDKAELAKGIKHEKEHTDDEALATKIAVDHLMEDPDYYTKMEKAGLEQEGALTPLEAGLKECGCGGDCGCAGVAGVAGHPGYAGIFVEPADAEQETLKTSGIGSGAAPVLKSDKLEAPAEKNQVGPNKVVVGKTPTITGQADPLDHFASQIQSNLEEKW